MTVFVYRPTHPDADDRGMVPLSIAHEVPKGKAPNVISDTMAPTKHMASGRVIDSKARFRAETKAAGCIETGDQLPTKRQPIKLDRSQRRDDIRRTLYEFRNGRRPD